MALRVLSWVASSSSRCTGGELDVGAGRDAGPGRTIWSCWSYERPASIRVNRDRREGGSAAGSASPTLPPRSSRYLAMLRVISSHEASDWDGSPQGAAPP